MDGDEIRRRLAIEDDVAATQTEIDSGVARRQRRPLLHFPTAARGVGRESVEVLASAMVEAQNRRTAPTPFRGRRSGGDRFALRQVYRDRGAKFRFGALEFDGGDNSPSRQRPRNFAGDEIEPRRVAERFVDHHFGDGEFQFELDHQRQLSRSKAKAPRAKSPGLAVQER